MSIDDLGKRIAAARGYTGMSIQSLADAVNVTVPALERFEGGLEDLSEGDCWALVKAIAAATRLPEQFFTVDFESLIADEPPEVKLSRLEQRADETLSLMNDMAGVVNEALARMNEVSREADAQMTRGKEQLDRFVEHQAPDHELLVRIAEHLGVTPG
jgi:transcriptional regulator with XRE-family HTH domain